MTTITGNIVKEHIMKKAQERLQKEQKNKEAGANPPKQTSETIGKSIAQKRPDYADFQANNWIKDPNVEILQELDSKGMAMWLDPDGSLSYKINGSIFKKVDVSKAKIIISNILERNISLFSKESDIRPKDLILVQKEVFDPRTNFEFFQKGHGYYRNAFQPTKYMKLTDSNYKEPKTILKLIHHLVTYNDEYYRYFLNWLAYFWQTMQRPNTAIALKGTQGTGKGILFERVIQKLFGKNQTVQVNDSILKSQYLAPIFENKLFYNLDEISQGYKDNKRLKNMLKGLVTNDVISLERKYSNIEKPILLKGAVLITSNEPKFLEIEPGDRRYNIFSSNKKLIEVDFLVGSYDKLIAAIQEELEDFAKYLYHYPVDAKQANVVMETPEREALIEATTDKFTLFANAIKNKNLDFFAHLNEGAPAIYEEIKKSFSRGRIKQSLLTPWFNKTFDEEVKRTTLLKELRTRDNVFTKTRDVHGYPHIILDEEDEETSS